jgi:drug/metabolite transporter (DMT)-like permease
VAKIIWLRFVSQAILVGAGLILTRHTLFVSSYIELHVLRGFTTTTSSYLFFLAIIYMPLADATALIQLGPVMATLGAVLVLGEKIGRRRIMGIAAAFIGAMLIIKPGTSVMITTSLFPFLGAMGFTIYALATRFVRSDGRWVSLFLQGFFWYVIFIDGGAILLATHRLKRGASDCSAGGLWNIGPSVDDLRRFRQRHRPLWLRRAIVCNHL